MAENSNYTLGHTISCNMNMIHEFSAGVNGLFMNAQDILNEGKGILNTISGIMGSIPGEALHGGLSDSIRECLSRLETCDMGMEGFVLVRKANSYVDNLYGADSSHAEKVRGCAGYFQSLIQKNIQLHMIGENGKGIPSILQIIRNLKLNGIPEGYVDNDEELQRRMVTVSDEYVDWLWKAEVDKNKMRPYIDSEDSDEAKGLNTITLPMGVTFNDEGVHLNEIEEVMGWEDSDIEIIRGKLKAGEISWVEDNYPVNEDEAKELFRAAQKDYVKQVNAAIDSYNNQNGSITYYTQNQLDAMFDYAYNNGLDMNNINKKINNPDTMIYYYLRKDQEGAVAASERCGTDNDRRRVNQMNLFFNNDYDFADDKYDEKFETVREQVGF